jgi:hypothetical protein
MVGLGRLHTAPHAEAERITLSQDHLAKRDGLVPPRGGTQQAAR